MRISHIFLGSLTVGVVMSWLTLSFTTGHAVPPTKSLNKDRSPVDLALSADERFLFTVNQTSNTISAVETKTGRVLSEVATHERPCNLLQLRDSILVSCSFSHEVQRFHWTGIELKLQDTLWVGHEPRGMAISADQKKVYVALSTAHSIAVIDLSHWKVTNRIEVGKWPRFLKLNPDGSKLIVGCSGDGGVSIIDTASETVTQSAKFEGINQGMMSVSKDGKYVYVPYMYYRGFPVTSGNIKLGWVLTSRIGRIRIDDPKKMTSLYLDTPLKAVSDPFAAVLSEDQTWLACTASGTHEIHIFKNEGLPFRPYSSDFTMDKSIRDDAKRYKRVELGGRPMGQVLSSDGKTSYIANYLLNCVQVVDFEKGELIQTIPVGGTSELSLARKGEAIFFDGNRSLDHWYSCHSCHNDGHHNGLAMDTLNDGRFGSMKMTLTLRNAAKTGPWTWHGWQSSLDESIHKSLKDSMLGPPHNEEDVTALKAYIASIPLPENPNKKTENPSAVERGALVFKSDKAQCNRCHSGPLFTDGKVHKVGLENRSDKYEGFNPPSLIGVYDRIKYLHDGRAASLKEVLTGAHNPDKLNHNGELSEQELNDLISYLKTL